MKSNIFTLKINSLFAFALIIGLSIFTQSCAKKISFNGSTVVPAAQGSVKVKKDNNNNYNLSLKVIRLANPKRLDPPKNTYVVWMDSKENRTKNIGQLKTSSGMFSKTLKSSLKTVSPFKPTKIFITAEDDVNIQYPSGQNVMTTGNF